MKRRTEPDNTTWTPPSALLWRAAHVVGPRTLARPSNIAAMASPSGTEPDDDDDDEEDAAEHDQYYDAEENSLDQLDLVVVVGGGRGIGDPAASGHDRLGPGGEEEGRLAVGIGAHFPCVGGVVASDSVKIR